MTTPHVSNAWPIKRAELTSSAGAGIMGAGLGALTGRWLQPYAVVILVIGIAMHGSGMYVKHRLEAAEFRGLWWVELLYWSCWVSLAALVAFVIMGHR